MNGGVTYNRGNDKLNLHYHYLDLVPKRRDDVAGRLAGLTGGRVVIAPTAARFGGVAVGSPGTELEFAL